MHLINGVVQYHNRCAMMDATTDKARYFWKILICELYRDSLVVTSQAAAGRANSAVRGVVADMCQTGAATYHYWLYSTVQTLVTLLLDMLIQQIVSSPIHPENKTAGGARERSGRELHRAHLAPGTKHSLSGGKLPGKWNALPCWPRDV